MTGEWELDSEHRLAVLTNWGLCGSFGLCTVMSGFRADLLLVTLAGYALFLAGFIVHLIVNRIYGRDFRPGEVATAMGLFGIATVSFMASWAFDPQFSERDVLAGLIGLVVAIGAFFSYLTARYGLKGSFSMFHTQPRA